MFNDQTLTCLCVFINFEVLCECMVIKRITEKSTSTSILVYDQYIYERWPKEEQELCVTCFPTYVSNFISPSVAPLHIMTWNYVQRIVNCKKPCTKHLCMSYWLAWSIRTLVIYFLTFIIRFRTCNSIPDISDILSFKTTYCK